MKKKHQWVRSRHKFWYCIAYLPMRIFCKKQYHYKFKKFKYDKKQNYFIISNHQTDLDAIFCYMAMGRPIYPMTTDSLFSSKYGKFLSHAFGMIPKRKGAADQKAIKGMLQVAKEGGDIMIFPEGNRTYAEFQYQVDPSIVKLIKKCRIPVMFVNVEGGTGVSPRFATKPRGGDVTLSIKRILSVEEVNSYSDEDLYTLLLDTIKVYDSFSGREFKSNYNAEYLECMLFTCPVCGGVSTLKSEGNFVHCSCGLNVEYTSKLRLTSDSPNFNFQYLNDWYQYQKKWVRNVEIIPDQVIFEDDDVEIYISHINEKRKLITKDKLILTDKYLKIGDLEILVNEIEMASPISGRKFNFNTKDETYLVIGSIRFNPLKYIFMFNKLDTKMKGKDIYYTIED